jgi:hypothetical protein
MTATERIAYLKAYYLKNKKHMNEAARNRYYQKKHEKAQSACLKEKS